MNSDLISICIPTYNGERYLKACLDSCLSQTYQHFEVIICDDCSTDNTISIINEYLIKDNRFKFVKNSTNLGLVGNWNKCIHEATGVWIKFIFQDDYLQVNCLEKFAQVIDKNLYLAICKRHYSFEEDISNSKKSYFLKKAKFFDKYSNGNIIKVDAKNISSLITKNIALNFIVEPSFAFFRKEFVSIHGEFDSTFHQICDLEFFQRIGSIYGITYIPEALATFRIHDRSTTSTNLANKNYIIKYLEPLLLLNKLFNHKAYTNFRSHLHTKDKARLKFYEKTRLVEAQNEATANSDHGKILEIYARSYPFLSGKVKNEICYKAVLELVKLKRKILG